MLLPVKSNTLLRCLQRLMLGVFPSHRFAASYRHKSRWCLFFLIFIVNCTIHKLCPHTPECHSLEWLCEHICPHFLCWAVNHPYLSTVDSVLDKKELCFYIFCFLSTGESPTFPLMVSSTTTKITKTMKFPYHIYIGTSSETN